MTDPTSAVPSHAPDEAPPGAPPTITPTVAGHVLWAYGETAPAGLGMEPGTFVRALIEAFRTADHLNQARLAMGFPSYYLAVRMLNAGGPEALRGIAAELREHQRVGAEEEARAAYRGHLGEVAAAQEVLAAETGEQLEDVFSLAMDVVKAIEAERRRTGPVWLEEHFIPRSEVSVMLGAVRQLWDYLSGPVGHLIDQAERLVAPSPAAVDWPGPELSRAGLGAVHDALERWGVTITDPGARELVQEIAAARLLRDQPGTPTDGDTDGTDEVDR